jgi:homospermidine synthase
MNDTLLNQFDMVESQLCDIYKMIGAEIGARFLDQNDAEYAELQQQLITVKGLLHTVRDTLRAAAPELYTDF